MKSLSRILPVLIGLVAMLVVISTLIVIRTTLQIPVANSGRLPVTDMRLLTPTSPEENAVKVYLEQHVNDLNTPAGNDGTPVVFTILPGELPADIAPRLQTQGLIKDADLFLKLAKYLKVDTKIQAGEYVLRRTMKPPEVLDAIQHGPSKMITVTIRPGWRAEEIADYIGTLGLQNYDRDEFLRLVRVGNFNYSFLKDRPKSATTSVDGFLFPETYHMPADIPTAELIQRMLDTFNMRVTDATRQKAAAQKLTLFEVVTLASMIEREVIMVNERSLVASVLLNRLRKKMFLQMDSTAKYALGYQAATKLWWKSPATLDELANANSPYNTYRNPGMPPGPICNPSLDSITAVVMPAHTDYLFFYAKADGSLVFAKTYQDHQLNQQKYGK